MKIGNYIFNEEKDRFSNEIPLKSTNDFLCLLGELKKLWFRGVSKANYRLVPSIYRSSIWNYNAQDAQEMFMEFKRRAHPYLTTRPTEWELYQIMQHYGTPTRLLDWTESPLVTLFFALINSNAFDYPSVWVIDPNWLNKEAIGDKEILDTMDYESFEDNKGNYSKINIVKSYFENEGNDLPDFPVAVKSSFIDKRIVAQKSCFTIHGRLKSGFSEIFQKSKNPQILQFRFTNECVGQLKKEIILLGTGYSTIFPDLEGLTKELLYEYNMS